MQKQNIFFYIFIGFIVLLCLKIYYDTGEYYLKCIISHKDGNKYCVRDRDPAKLQLAADLLATVTENCNKLVSYMSKKYPNDERVKRLVAGFNPKSISETLPTSELTAYSENKGEKIAFCLNKKKNENNKLIDMNTLMFVALHEVSHIMTESIGHKQEFWQNFKFVLINAVAIKVYKPIDYRKKPEDYCGMEINDNPYYDLV